MARFHILWRFYHDKSMYMYQLKTMKEIMITIVVGELTFEEK